MVQQTSRPRRYKVCSTPNKQNWVKLTLKVWPPRLRVWCKNLVTTHNIIIIFPGPGPGPEPSFCSFCVARWNIWTSCSISDHSERPRARPTTGRGRDSATGISPHNYRSRSAEYQWSSRLFSSKVNTNGFVKSQDPGLRRYRSYRRREITRSWRHGYLVNILTEKYFWKYYNIQNIYSNCDEWTFGNILKIFLSKHFSSLGW